MYSVDQIKLAFWKTFHESGEIWFDYLSSPEENESSTNEEWEVFLENLTTASTGRSSAS